MEIEKKKGGGGASLHQIGQIDHVINYVNGKIVDVLCAIDRISKSSINRNMYSSLFARQMYCRWLLSFPPDCVWLVGELRKGGTGEKARSGGGHG